MEGYISLKLCPICGEPPEYVKESLGRPGGHGYPGHFDYQYKCECCQLIKGETHHDIYDSPENTKNRAKLSWNQKVESIQAILNRRYILKDT